jgi:hypothetical protein
MNKTVRRRRLRVHSLVAAVAVTCLAGCSQSEQNAKPPRVSPKETLAFNAADPATWVLPIQGYLPSDGEKRQVSQAKKLLIGDCMKSFGFNWTPAPDLPKVGPKTLVDWRYGIHDMALAKERGYKPSAAEQEAYDQAVNLGAVDGTSGVGPDAQTLSGGIKEVGGKPVPEGGCIGEADRRISAAAVQAAGAQKLGNEAFTKSKQVPQVTQAFAVWSACMKASGYTYAQPLDASDDPRFGSRDVTPLERATATADITCRNKTNVAKIWFDAEAALQDKEIEVQAEQLDKDRKDLNAAVKKAAAVVAGTR